MKFFTSLIKKNDDKDNGIKTKSYINKSVDVINEDFVKDILDFYMAEIEEDRSQKLKVQFSIFRKANITALTKSYFKSKNIIEDGLLVKLTDLLEPKNISKFIQVILEHNLINKIIGANESSPNQYFKVKQEIFKKLNLQPDVSLDVIKNKIKNIIIELSLMNQNIKEIATKYTEFEKNKKDEDLATTINLTIKLLQSENLLQTIIDPTIAFNKNPEPINFIKLADIVSDNAKLLQNLIEKGLDIKEVSTLLQNILTTPNLKPLLDEKNINPESINLINKTLPEVTNYVAQNIVKHLADNSEDIKIIANNYETYKQDMQNLQFKQNLSDSLVNFLPKTIDAIADQDKINKIIISILPQQPSDNTKAIIQDVSSLALQTVKVIGSQKSECKNIINDYITYANSSDKNPSALIDSGLKLLLNEQIQQSIKPEALNAIIDKTVANEQIAEILFTNKDNITNKNDKKALLNFGLKLTKEQMPYLGSLLQTTLKLDETKALILNASEYFNNKNNDKSLENVISSGLNLLSNKEFQESFYKEENLVKIINSFRHDDSIKSPIQKINSKIKEDFRPLVNLLANSLPKIISSINKDENSKKLIGEFVTLSKNNASLKEVYRVVKNNKGNITNLLKSNQNELANIIDESLGLTVKNNMVLKLLKPCGINGKFITSILSKIASAKTPSFDICEKFSKDPKNIGNILAMADALGCFDPIASNMKKLYSKCVSAKNLAIKTVRNKVSHVEKLLSSRTNSLNRLL